MSSDLHALGRIVQERQRAWRVDAAADRRLAGSRPDAGGTTDPLTRTATTVRRLAALVLGTLVLGASSVSAAEAPATRDPLLVAAEERRAGSDTGSRHGWTGDPGSALRRPDVVD